NPLTIIAIFAAIVEASALASLPFLKDDSQDLYTWFLIGFPPFLTLLFFVTLNFNYKVLYSPSDFSNEGDFLQIAKGGAAPPCNTAAAKPDDLAPPPEAATEPSAASHAQAPPGAAPRQERMVESRALYILDCQHFACDEQLGSTVNEILKPNQGPDRHLIILYRTPQLRSPVSQLLTQVLSQAFEGGTDCVISAYDLDEAALTTLTRRLASAPGRPIAGEP
ncbi:hypothetical protein, partial [Pseudomonas sp.]